MKNFFKRVGLQFFAEDGGEPTGTEQQEPTSQNEGLEDSDGFEDGFGDWGELSPEVIEEPEQTLPQNDETQPQTEQNTPQFVTVPYNGQNVNVPLDALTALNNVFGGNIGQILERGLAPQQPVQPVPVQIPLPYSLSYTIIY